MSVPLVITVVVGLIMMVSGALSFVLFPRLSVDLASLLFLLGIFATAPSWEFFLVSGARYYLTNQRVLVASHGESRRELGLDNIESVSRVERMKLGSWRIYFPAADGSDIDRWRNDEPVRWTMKFSYLWKRESAKAERLIIERLLPIKEPRVYRCMSCSFQGNTEQELRDHINVKHGGSAT